MVQRAHIKSKYTALVDIFKERIAAGELRPGEQLPTLEQICQLYDVSHITARHAIDVLAKDGLIYRVQGKGTFVAEQGFQPRTIALCLPHLYQDNVKNVFEHAFSIPIIHAIEKAARGYNANIVLYLANDSLVVERENLLSVLNQRPVGAIISHLGGGNEDILNQLAEQIPVVLIDRYPQEWPGSFVVTDNYKGAHQLTEALLEHGFSRIHHIVSHEYVSSTRDRQAGYLSVMRSHGLTTEKLVHQVTADPIGDVTVADATYQITRQIIAEESYPYALFGTNTEVMASIWQAVQDANVDLSQVGLACFDAPAFFIPPEAFFVQAEQPLAKIGHQSVHVVMDQVHGIHDPRRIMLDPIVKYPTVEIQTI